jgi:methylenetetrahydrofolate reductase (NADPH)
MRFLRWIRRVCFDTLIGIPRAQVSSGDIGSFTRKTMYAVRRFSVRHSRLFEKVYGIFEHLMVALDPVFSRIGYERLEGPVAAIERSVKGFLFDCKMCGQCVLSSTGMSCSMNCPKGLRNGPCGGVRAGGYCEVKPEMKCVWVDAWDGASRMKYGIHKISVVQPPVDVSLRGSSAWLRVAREKAFARRQGSSSQDSGRAQDPGRLAIAQAFAPARALEPASAPLSIEPLAAGQWRSNEQPRTFVPTAGVEEHSVRAGVGVLHVAVPYDPIADTPPVPPPNHHSASTLERTLRNGWFAVTAELNPPDSADPRDVLAAAEPLKHVVDAINATDASGANCHMSSMGISSILARAGMSVVLQISCRDRNRIAIQGDVLGAAAMGVSNVLCLTGDGVAVGDQPGAKPVFDFDSLSLLRTLKTMRDEQKFLSGRKITSPPRVFLGAAENPCITPYELRADRLAKKVLAGADFIQTNYVFDVNLLERFMVRVRDLGLHEKVFILVGVGPLPSPRAARWMRANVPGIHIPDSLISRVERSANPADEGKKICVELIQQIREVRGIAGVHVMAYRREHLVEEIIGASGVLDERRVKLAAVS